MTTYAVCPHCHTVTPITPERTITEPVYRAWLLVRGTPGRIDVMQIAAELDVSARTARRYVVALADVGLVRRVALGGKYGKRARHAYEVAGGAAPAERRGDPGAVGEGTAQESAPVMAGAL